MSQITDKIDAIRAILKEYDDGMSTAASCEHDVGDLFIKPFLDAIENGSGYLTFGSCCCSGHPPNRTFKCEFVIGPHGFEAKRCT